MTDWEFLQRINFKNHDGVGRPMINDFMRNQFYERVLRNTVHNQRCLDIGFGTGLLSMLALKHGARHIEAYESDTDRYQLGCKIIDMLKLKDQITLINQRYTHTIGLDNIDVVITETVNNNLWWEGVFNSFPRQPGKNFVPGQYFLEIHAMPIPKSFAVGLTQHAPIAEEFAPGIDLDHRFVACVNLLTAKKNKTPIKAKRKINLTPGINALEKLSTVWGQNAFARAVLAGQCVAKYTIDAGQSTINTTVFDVTTTVPIDFDARQHQMRIDTQGWQDQTVLIVPRAGMQHGDHKLYLDTGHWGTTQDPVILHQPQHTLTVTHRLTSGAIHYNLGK
jgi:hypothetical protein